MPFVAVSTYFIVVWLLSPGTAPVLYYKAPTHDAQECADLVSAFLEAGPPEDDDVDGEIMSAVCTREQRYVRQGPA